MKTIKRITSVLGSILIAYILTVFVSLDFNPLDWENIDRFLLISISIIVFWIIFGYKIIDDDF